MKYLTRFPIDKIKIDRTFIRNLGQKADSTAIVRSVVALGHALGMTVTAEGVETSDQSTFLKAVGCDELQGFLYSEALAEHLIGSFVENRQSVEATWAKPARQASGFI